MCVFVPASVYILPTLQFWIQSRIDQTFAFSFYISLVSFILGQFQSVLCNLDRAVFAVCPSM